MSFSSTQKQISEWMPKIKTVKAVRKKFERKMYQLFLVLFFHRLIPSYLFLFQFPI